MQTVIIVIHLMIVIAMIAVILLQRSEGGALGIGGGGGGAMFSARGSANLLTRTTTILAVVFFVTSLALGLLARSQSDAPSILSDGEGVPPGATVPLGDAATRGTGEGLLEELQQSPSTPGEPLPAPPTDAGAPDPGAVPVTPGGPEVPSGQ
ncbi:preprotein translocase subunit SecG [Acuticoccus sp.]|uniref:preprotein translocase subunit SecG n=1 Tax=Acuticoccus sp. TaxID=1904378 RepID=UPI003B51C22E